MLAGCACCAACLVEPPTCQCARPAATVGLHPSLAQTNTQTRQVPAQMWEGEPGPGAVVAGCDQGRSKKSFVPFAVQANLVHTRLCPWAADGTKRFPQLALSARRFWRTAQERAAKCRCGPVPCAPPSERAARCRSGRRTLARRRRVPSRAQCPAPGGQCRYCDYRYPGGPCCVVQTRCRVSIYCALGRWTA